jgi:protease-4
MRRRKRLVLFLLLVVVVTAWLSRRRVAEPSIETGSYLLLQIEGQYTEAPPQDLVGQLLLGAQPRLIDLLRTIRKAEVDPRIQGVVARIGSLDVGWAKAQDVRDAFLQFKNSGKPLIALLEQEVTGSSLEYYVAAAADRIYLSPGVTAPLNGLAAHFFFLGGVWDKLDVEMHVEKMRQYKSMGDLLANKEMTEAHREMANSLLDSVEAQFVDGIASSRDLSPEAVRNVIDDCPVSPEAFEAEGLSDGTKYLTTLHDALGGEQTPLVRMEDYGRVDETTLGLGVGPQVAVVYAVGAVVLGKSGRSVQGDTLGSETVARALNQAADDDEVEAIVLRIDSPGGSALASDLLWQAVHSARAKKPVIVSMSDVAASGGYYMAAAANRVVAQPATMTGSIGVVVARPYVRGLLKRLGIHTETISRGKFAGLDDLTTPLTEEGRARLVAEMEHVYYLFVDRVAAGREMTRETVDELGGGRVWTGAQAKDRGLVDELGGFRRAIDVAKEAAGIDLDEEVQLVFFPKAEGVLERFGKLIGMRMQVEVPSAWRELLGAVATPFRRGTILATMDAVVEIR